MQNRQSLLDHYRQMRQDLLTAIAGLTDNQLSDPSLDGWSVRDHLAHIAFWDEIRSNEIVRISAGYDTSWPIDEADKERYHELGYELRRDFSLDQARWELETSHQMVLEAITAATNRGLDDSLYGDAGLLSDHEAEHTTWITRWRGEQGL